MKYTKYIFALLVVAVLLTFALPASAQGPIFVKAGDKNLRVFVRTAGTNEDPFGGFCRNYNGATAPGAGPQLGAPADFGLNPFGRCDVGGGVPSVNSGDGSSMRKAVYIGGAWDPTVTVNAGETGYELPSCATLKVPAGVSRWYKADTWYNKKLQVWLDDEKNDATSPSGKAVFGAADGYMWGTAPGDAWQSNAFFDSPNSFVGNQLVGPSLEGYVMAIYDPDNLKANTAFPAPNAAILTVNVSGSGSPRRYEQGGAWGSKSLASGGFGGIHGYGQYNPNQTSHLLWFESVFDGWVYIRVYNQQIWDGVVSTCTYRATRD